MEKFIHFLEKLNINNRDFSQVKFVNLDIDVINSTWILELRFPEMIEVKEYLEFEENLYLFVGSAVKKIDLRLEYEKIEYQKVDMLAYFKYAVNKITQTKPRFIVFNKFNIQFNNKVYTVYVDSENGNLHKELSEITIELNKLGLEIKAVLEIDDRCVKASEIIDARSKELEKAFVENQKIAEAPILDVVLKNTRYTKKNTLPLVSISEIPVDQVALDYYQNHYGRPNFCICGEIFFIELKKLTKTHLLEIKLVGNNDAIHIKKFMWNKEEIEEASKLFIGNKIKVSGLAQYDTYVRSIVLMADTIELVPADPKPVRMDLALNKRVELHLHTKMSALDGISEAKDYISEAIRFGHKAIAFTDHNAVYAYPEIFQASQKKEIKIIYGLEASFVDENKFNVALTSGEAELRRAVYVVFDLETTGFSTIHNEIIEIGALKIQNGIVIDEFQTFVKPKNPIPKYITELTTITDDMVKDASGIEEIMPKFKEFIQDTILVAHNATFDISHIYANFKRLNISHQEHMVIDTLQLARAFYSDKLKKFNLKAVAKFFKVVQKEHHRAVDDASVTKDIFIKMLEKLSSLGIKNYQDINSCINEDDIWKFSFPTHLSILVKEAKGLKNLYKMLSDSLSNHYYKEPKLLKSVLETYRDGVLIGSGCYKGEVFQAALNSSDEILLSKMAFYDYIEIQPPSLYIHVLEDVNKLDIIKQTLIRIIEYAKKLNKLVVATGDVHYIHKEEKEFRNIYIKAPLVGGGVHDLYHSTEIPSQHFMTTDEMLAEFSFLDASLAYELVVTNSNIIADMIDCIQPFTKELYVPKDDFFNQHHLMNIPSTEKALVEMVNEQVFLWYGKNPPKIVSDRVEKELKSIITNKFSTIYYFSHLLVKKSLEDGYLVGSRGSVGSSFVATLMNITEVNPLSPHYRCPKCQFSSFKMTLEEKGNMPVLDIEKELQVHLDQVDCGLDLPNMLCPKCQTSLIKDGHDIPFETFLGFKGDKIPDIDLNFSSEYQAKAHEYIREIMGEKNAFRAGTITTVASKNAKDYVEKYLEKTNQVCRETYIEYLASKIIGVKRSTGQHPGGIVIVPDHIEIFDITPLQYPADDQTASWKTTHFDYHSFENNLLKMDILGHDDPTLIKFLMDYVNTYPDQFPFRDAKDIPLDDERVYRLFYDLTVINVKRTDILSETATFAMPEFGTDFTMQMLSDTKPKNFAGLVKISGLSHGTDVWLNNSQDLVLGKTEFGKIDFKEIIGCRDDIMVYLTYRGLEPAKAFEIMEFVRKGNPSRDKNKWREYASYMEEKNIPKWYISSCEKIKYMFPKAHATAYVLMAMRIGWFKINCPILFYSAYFSIRATHFEPEILVGGYQAIKKKIIELSSKEFAASYNIDINEFETNKDFSDKNNSKDYLDKNSEENDEAKTETKEGPKEALLNNLKVALEMTARGFQFLKVDILKSDATKFLIEGEALRIPLIAISGLGVDVAKGVIEQRGIKPFTSREDVKKRTRLNRTVMQSLESLKSLDSLSEEEKEAIDGGLFAYLS